MTDEDSITFTMAEFGKFQNDLLNLKHENVRLKANSEKYEEILKVSSNPVSELLSLRKSLEEQSSKFSTSKEELQTRLKSVLEIQDDDPRLESIFKGLEVQTDVQQKASLFSLQEKNRKLTFSNNSLLEKCRGIEKGLEELTDENSNLQKRVKELETQKENLIIDLASHEEEVTAAREALKEKFALECQKHELEMENAKLNKSLQDLTGNDSIKSELEIARQELSNCKKQLEEAKNNENILDLEYNSLKQSAREHIQALNNAKSEIEQLRTSTNSLEEQSKKMKTMIEDAQTEKMIIKKRTTQDLKDLKAELAKEKKNSETYFNEKETLFEEVRRLQDLQRISVRSSNPVSANEKIIVEDLSLRVSELEKDKFYLLHVAAEYEEAKKELIDERNENDALKKEIARLQLDLATLGAQFNEMIRSGNFKS